MIFKILLCHRGNEKFLFVLPVDYLVYAIYKFRKISNDVNCNLLTIYFENWTKLTTFCDEYLLYNGVVFKLKSYGIHGEQ